MSLKDPHLCDPTDRLRSLSNACTNISLDDLIQEGTFGQVYQGKLGTQEPILVKTVTGKYEQKLVMEGKAKSPWYTCTFYEDFFHLVIVMDMLIYYFRCCV